MTNTEDLICEYDNCQLILENPITLPCGHTLCFEHLNKFNHKFTCYFCQKAHLIPDDGFVSNIIMNKIIANYYRLNPMRKEIKLTFDELGDLIEEYEKFNPECFVYDYFGDIRNEVDLHRELLKKEIDEKSDEIIRKLNKKEEKCKANLSKVVKTNLDKFKKDMIQSWRQTFRMPDVNELQINELSTNLSEKISNVKNELKNYKDKLMLNESIQFERYEKSSLFGELIIKKIGQPLLANFNELIREYKQHTNTIRSIQVDEISNKFITGSADKTIKIWNLTTGECLKTLNDHILTVTIILIIPNNRFISGSADRNIKIWDLNTYECLDTLTNLSPVYSLCLISDNRLACGCSDGFISIWNLKYSSSTMKFKAHYDWILFLLLAENSKLISCSGEHDSTIKIWSIESYQCIQVLEGHWDAIRYLSLSPNGNLFSCSNDLCLKIWQIETGRMLQTLLFNYSVNCISIINNNLIAVGLDNGEIMIYDLNEMKSIKTILAHSSCVYRMNLLSNGNLLTGSNAGDVRLWDIL